MIFYSSSTVFSLVFSFVSGGRTFTRETLAVWHSVVKHYLNVDCLVRKLLPNPFCGNHVNIILFIKSCKLDRYTSDERQNADKSSVANNDWCACLC